MTKNAHLSVQGLGLTLLSLVAGLGCGDDTGSATVDAPVMAADAGADQQVAYQGPTSGGSIPAPPVAEGDAGTDVTVVADNRCCNVTLSLPDPTGDETTPLLFGNQYPLDVPGGVALTHSNGAWQASACLPVNIAIEYAFSFTVPFGVSSPDGGASFAPPDGAASVPMDTDAGFAADAYTPDPVDALNEAPPTTMIELRYNSSMPMTPDGAGSFRNVFGPVSDCASIGASTGTIQ
jgi:hypothetical protein